MDNDFLHLHLLKNKDIQEYLSVSFAHLNTMISSLETLSQNSSEKNHVIDILDECVYIKEDLIKLIRTYQDYDNEQTFITIQENIQNLYSIEEELISDYPEIFKNSDEKWYIYKENIVTNIEPPILSQYSEKKSSKNSIKRWAFGLFFLFPTFLFIIFYPLFRQGVDNIEENYTKQHILEHDRAYKNIFYLYSAALKNTSADNFYSLMQLNSFKLPEGFVIIDKNLMVDYYLKEYYSLTKIEDEISFTIIAVSNLNFKQCKYILTKFSGINIEKVISNDKEIVFEDNFNPDIYCNSEKNTNNLISFYVKNN